MARPETRTARYRFYDAEAVPLYFGVAVDPERRWLGHRNTDWWGRVDHGRTRVDWYPTWNLAHAAEVEAIAAEQPRYNRAHADYHRPLGMGTTELRGRVADVLNKAVYGEITFVTTRGRRIAAIVPAPDGERLWRERQEDHDDRPRSSA